MIELEHVNKRFGKQHAVVDLSLVVPEGSVFGLLGHNGAGKSTALGMLLGQVFPDSGALRIEGRDVFADRPGALRRVGAIFESPVFYNYLSGWRNLCIFASYSHPVPRRRIDEVVELVGLTGRIHDRVGAYSHGMRQRLALAQALLPDSKLLILDEPADGLDPEGIAELRDLIARLNREMGLTILFSSHHLSEADQVCTHVAVMRQGRLLHSGAWHDAHGWVELQVDRADEAVAQLQSLGMVTEAVDGRVRLSEGLEPADLTEHLVRSGFRVSTVKPIKLTLESFYLKTIDDGGAA